MYKFKNIFYLIITLTFLCNSTSAISQAKEKAVVGISAIETTVSGSDAAGFRTMVETAIISSNRFSVIERGRLDSILQEQMMGEAGITDSNQGIGVSGIDYLIYGTITQLGAKASGSSFAGISNKSSTMTMAVDLRITDVSTGEIMFAGTVDKETSTGKSFSYGGISKSNSSDSSSDLGELQREVAQSIASILVTRIYPIKVVTVQGDGTIVINYGNSILNTGDFLEVSELGEGFIDPDTGIMLGQEETQIGIIEITEATSQFSKATLVEGDLSNISAGQIARQTEEAPAKKTEKKKSLF